MASEWVLVECVSSFRIRYMVEVPEGKSEWALDTVANNEAVEFSQEYLGEHIVSHRVVSEADAISMCRRENDYISVWDDEKVKAEFFTAWNETENKE